MQGSVLTDLLQVSKGEPLSSGLSTDGSLISASAVPPLQGYERGAEIRNRGVSKRRVTWAQEHKESVFGVFSDAVTTVFPLTGSSLTFLCLLLPVSAVWTTGVRSPLLRTPIVIKGSLLKPGVSQNVALHASPTANNCTFPISGFPVHSSSFFFTNDFETQTAMWHARCV